jgi:hypothetical protein
VTSASTPLAAQGSPKLLRTNRPLKLSRDLRNVPVERYRLEKDGRKWRVIARERMALAEWLGTHADYDGSRIFPSVKSMSRHFGWSRRKVFYLLEDLKTLGLLVREPDGRRGPLTGEHGTRIRRINLPAFLGAEVQDSRAEVQDSSASAAPEVQDSRAEVHSNVAHNRHLTDTKTKPKAASPVENSRSARNPAAQSAASSSLPFSKIENRKLLPQNIRYARVSRLTAGAKWVYQEARASRAPLDRASWKEDTKRWAAQNDVPYDADTIEEALDQAQRKICEPPGAGAAADGSRRVSAKSFAEGMCAER